MTLRLLTALVVATLSTIGAFAQSPHAFNYQGVARDASGDALVNQNIGVQFQLHQTTAVGNVVYSETHSPTTNDLGTFSVEVGNGTPGTGMFSPIDWTTGPYFLEVAIDPAGAASYSSVGTQQLLSVPYALHASSTDCNTVSMLGDTLHQGAGCFVIIPGISAANGGCADADEDGFYDQAGCGTLVDCNDNDPTINPNAVEVCDGLDNNCDLQTDEGDPLIGTPCGSGVGTCQQGTWACMNGALVCVGGVGPSTEVCDGLDNDCNGTVDDGNPGGGAACGGNGGIGVCQPGVVTCVNGSLTCVGEVQPSAEVCDGLDNDCNGIIDDGIDVSSDPMNCGSCGFACPAGYTCENGNCVAPCPVSGSACDDGDPCTTNDTEDGICNCSGTPLNCDDGIGCTIDMCVAGSCTYTIQNGKCFIAGTCYNDGELRPGFPCQECESSTSQTTWTSKPNGTTCGPSMQCQAGVCVSN